MENRGFATSPDARAIRLEVENQETFMDSLRLEVSMNGEWVTSHAVELILFDADARRARTYRTNAWRVENVFWDLQRLAAEQR